MEATNVGCATGLVVYRDNGKRLEYTTEKGIKIRSYISENDYMKIGAGENTNADFKIYSRKYKQQAQAQR